MAATPPYSPKPGPVQDDPKITEIVQWAQREMEAISRQFTNFNILQQNVSYAVPDRPREGMNAVADGSFWNPGAGAGAYTFVNGGWVLNTTGPIPPFPSLSGYMIRSNNLSDVTNMTTAHANLGLVTLALTGHWNDVAGKPAFGNVIGYNVNVASGVPLLQASGHYEAFDGSHIANIPTIAWPYPGLGIALTASPWPGLGPVGWGVAVAGIHLGWLSFSTSVTGTGGCGFVTSIGNTVTWNQWNNLGGTWYNLTGQTINGCFGQEYGTFVRLA